MKDHRRPGRWIPLLGQLRSYRPGFLYGDLNTGLLLAVLVIPQGMAYAIIAGLPPITGLYAAIFAPVAYALIGSLRTLAVGPAAMISFITFAALSPLGLDPGTLCLYGSMLALVVGAAFLAVGIFRLTFFDNLLSRSVLNGFTMAAAFIIAVTQLKDVLGLNLASHSDMVLFLWEMCSRLGEVHVPSLLTGAATLGALILCRRIDERIPAGLLVLLLGTAAGWWFEAEKIGISVLGPVPSGLPGFRVPALQIQHVQPFIRGALTVFVIGLLESFTIAKALAARAGDRLPVSREMMALGASNLLVAFFRGYPVGASFSRSALTVRSGARTLLASLFGVLFVCLFVLFLTGTLYHLPRPCLSALIIFMITGIVNLREVRRTFRVRRQEGAVVAFTAIFTVLTGVDHGIIVGVLLSLWFVLSDVIHPHAEALGRQGEAFVSLRTHPQAVTSGEVGVLRFQAPMYFLNVHHFQVAVFDLLGAHPETRWLLIDAAGIPDMDVTAMEELARLRKILAERGCRLRFVHANEFLVERLGLLETDEMFDRNLLTLPLAEAFLRAGRMAAPGGAGGEPQVVPGSGKDSVQPR